MKLNLKFATATALSLAEETFHEFIHANIPEVESVNELRGIYSNTLKGSINILLSGAPEYSTFECDVTSTGDKDVYTFDASFERSPQWHHLMDQAFECLSKYLAEGSYMDVHPDHGFYRSIIVDGKVEEYGTDEEINPYLESGEDFYDNLEMTKYGFYNKKTGDYVYMFVDEVYAIQICEHEMRELCSKVLSYKNHDKCWYEVFSDEQLVRREFLGNDQDEVAEKLQVLLDKASENEAEEEWTPANALVSIYA